MSWAWAAVRRRKASAQGLKARIVFVARNAALKGPLFHGCAGSGGNLEIPMECSQLDAGGSKPLILCARRRGAEAPLFHGRVCTSAPANVGGSRLLHPSVADDGTDQSRIVISPPRLPGRRRCRRLLCRSARPDRISAWLIRGSFETTSACLSRADGCSLRSP